MKKNYFNLAALIERLTNKQRKIAGYENVECEMSFFIFNKKHPIRKLCYRVLMNKAFERFFLLNFVVTLLSMMAATFVDHES